MNEQLGNYWIEDDKNEIMIQYPTSYLLAIIFSYILYKRCGAILNTTYLAKFTLMLEESCLRNEIKLSAVLICNKDKEHIACLLHKLVKHFGNTFDILTYGNLYDVRYGMVDIHQYDIVISTEALDDLQHEQYCKISSLCTSKDIVNINEYIYHIHQRNSPPPYDVAVVHLPSIKYTVAEVVNQFLADHEQIDIVDEEIQTWEIEQAFYVRQEENALFLLTPLWRTTKTCLYQLLLEHPIYYKKHEYIDIKILVVSNDQIKEVAQLLSR